MKAKTVLVRLVATAVVGASVPATSYGVLATSYVGHPFRGAISLSPQQAGGGRDAGAAQTQSAVQGTGVISGQVTVAGTGQPLDEARVTLNGGSLRGPRTATADAEGRYFFDQLAPGSYTVRATRTGFVGGTYGQTRFGGSGTMIVLTEGQKFETARIEVAKGAVISGTVFDEKNRPSISTPVRIQQWMWSSGERTLNQVGSATTDDRGIYRAFGLQPGEYLVSAAPRNVNIDQFEVEMQVAEARSRELQALGLAGSAGSFQVAPASSGPSAQQGYAPVFYPGSTSLAGARSVRLLPGQEQLGIDIGLVQVGLSRVTGDVIVPPGVATNSVQVRLFDTSGVGGVQPSAARPNQTGTFTVNGVAPGQYTVVAIANVAQQSQAPPPQPAAPPNGPVQAPGQPTATRRYWAQAEIIVDGTSTPHVSLTLQEGSPITGTVAFNGSAAQPAPNALTRLRVNLVPVGQVSNAIGMGSLSGQVDATGRFTVPGVVPARYRVSATGVPPWQLASALANGQDALDFTLLVEAGQPMPTMQLEFADKTAEVSGTLTRGTGAPAPEYVVVIFPSEQRYWAPFARRMRTARPATDGKFSIASMPPGDYRLAAVTDIAPGEWFDPAFLEQLLPSSVAVRLVAGQPATQNIRVQ
jgi:hypothetical protein